MITNGQTDAGDRPSDLIPQKWTICAPVIRQIIGSWARRFPYLADDMKGEVAFRVVRAFTNHPSLTDQEAIKLAARTARGACVDITRDTLVGARDDMARFGITPEFLTEDKASDPGVQRDTTEEIIEDLQLSDFQTACLRYAYLGYTTRETSLFVGTSHETVAKALQFVRTRAIEKGYSNE